MLQAGLRPASGFCRFRFTAPFSRRPRIAVVGIGVGHFRDYDGLPGRNPRHFRAYSPFAPTFVRSVRSFSTRRARTTTGSPPDRKDAPSQGGAVVWEPSTRAHPRLHTRQNRGLGFRSGRSPYLGALKYHVVAAAPSAARPPPYRRACSSVLRRPLRDALPPRSLAHLPPDVRGRRARDSPDLRAHLRPP